MNFAFTEEQRELRETARAFLAENAGPAAARAAMETPQGYDAALWRQIGELGWCAAAIPEPYGGLGLGMVEQCILCEAQGYELLCAPYFSTVCLAANALLLCGDEKQKQRWLPAIAEGKLRAALAVQEGEHCWDAAGIKSRCEPALDCWDMHGQKDYVVDGRSAELILVAARENDEVALFALPGDAKGLARKALPTMDSTRRLAEITLHNTGAAGDAPLANGNWQNIIRAQRRAVAALAAEQLGGAQRCLDLALAHAKEREQFGRAIGSFQAIKHKLADMMVAVEAARSAVYYAACAIADEMPEQNKAAHMAKAAATDAYRHCAGAALQIFGGVGFTWEYDVHLYFKRAQSSGALMGDANFHRECIAKELEL